MGKIITSRLPDQMVEERERIAKLENLEYDYNPIVNCHKESTS